MTTQQQQVTRYRTSIYAPAVYGIWDYDTKTWATANLYTRKNECQYASNTLNALANAAGASKAKE